MSQKSQQNLISHGRTLDPKSIRKEFDHVEARLATLEQATPAATPAASSVSTQINTTVVNGYTPKTQVNVLGVMDGVNKNFELPEVPAVANAERGYLNGQAVKRGIYYKITGKYISVLGTPPNATTNPPDYFDFDYFV